MVDEPDERVQPQAETNQYNLSYWAERIAAKGEFQHRGSAMKSKTTKNSGRFWQNQRWGTRRLSCEVCWKWIAL